MMRGGAGLSPHKHDHKHDLYVPAVAPKFFSFQPLGSRPLTSMIRLHLLRPPTAGYISRFHTCRVVRAPRKLLKEFKLADIGEGITECEVIRWSVHALRYMLEWI